MIPELQLEIHIRFCNYQMPSQSCQSEEEQMA